METQRRNVLKKLLLSFAGIAGAGALTKAAAAGNQEASKAMDVVKDEEGFPLFSGVRIHNGFVFLAGIGAHFDGDITAHTLHVLEGMKKNLEKAGSSMNKVLQVHVFLNDIKDYEAMNKAYRGHFGDNPPVRTTVAVAKGGVPGNSLVEMDCMAYI